MAKAIWREWEDTRVSSFSKGYLKYRRNREYSNGNQSPDKYMKLFEIQDDPDTSYMKIDWQVPPVLPKFRRIALEKIGRFDYDIVAEAIDVQALTEKEEYEAKERANIRLRGSLKDLGIPSDAIDSGDPNQPMTDDDLKLKMQFTYKHREAADLEKRIESVFRDNKIHEDVRHQIRRDLFETGIIALRDEFDPTTGSIKVRRVDAAALGTSPTKDPFFKDNTYFFERIYMTPEEVKNMDEAGNITDEVIDELKDKFRGRYTQSTRRGFQDPQPYDKAANLSYFPVWDIEFKVVDRTIWERRAAPDGDRIGRFDYTNEKKKKGRDYSVDDQFTWLKMRWIEGTDYVFNYGPVSNIKRPFTKKWDAMPTFHVAAVEMNDMEVTSMVDNLKPIVDSVIIAWYKLQNAIMTARPKGIAIEIGAVEGIQMGGKDLEPMGVMDMFDHTGRLWWRRLDESGDFNNYKPIEELDNGIGTEASEWFNILDKYFNYIREMLGFNDFTDASTPNPKSLASVGAMATANTDNALNHIFRTEREILRRLSESAAIRIHDAIAFEDSNYYDNMLGSETILNIEEMKTSIERQYGIYIVDSGTDEEKQQLEIDMQQAMDLKQITIDDRILIRNIKNMKQAQMYLAIKVKQNIADERKYQKELQVENANAQQSAGEAVQAAKDKSINVEYDRKEKLAILEAELKERLLDKEIRLNQVTAANQTELDITRDREINQEQQATEASSNL
jgi:hypothetical protein